MLFRIVAQLLLTLAPLLTFALSPLVANSAEGQAAAPAGRYLVLYRNGQMSTTAADFAAANGARLVTRHDLLGVSVLEQVSHETRTQLAQDPNVEAIIPDIILNAHAIQVQAHVEAAVVPAPDSLYHSPQGWAVKQVGGFGADGTADAPKGPWNSTQGKGVRIAILDSGVDPNHPDISPNLALNLSEIKESALASACDDGTPVDQQGHGTWTASLAAGALGAKTGLVAGVAPQATILNIKVLQRMPGTKTAADPTGCIAGQASGLLSWVLQGIEDAITNRADIISMSLGTLADITTGDGAGEQAIFNRATQAAYNAGVVVIAAAGNDTSNLSGGRLVELPAQARDVLAIVASTNPACVEDLKAGASCIAGPVSLPYYSNFGSTLEALAAPGGSYPAAAPSGSVNPNAITGWVTGACSSGRPSTVSGLPDATHSFGCFNLGHAAYVQAIGTSASAPLVAGAAALILGAHPAWSPAQVVAALRASATPATTVLKFPQVAVDNLLTNVSK